MKQSVLIETYGCTLNQADSEMMGSLLKKAGYAVEHGRYGTGMKHDYVILNTCTVKAPTEQRILQRIGAMKGMGSRLVVAGCMASANPDKVWAAAPDASLIAPCNEGRITEALGRIGAGERVTYDRYSIVDKQSVFDASGSLSPVIAKIPISEGCLSSCSYCETKFARGPLNSFSERLILRAIEMSVARGAKEIDLTAQDAGAYGMDKKTNVAELLKKASQISGDFRIRVGMLNPEHLHWYLDDLVEAYRSEKVYKFIHLPVQSGSDSVLRSMGRRYKAEDFRNYVSELRKRIPEVTVETDIIVGYPTETKGDFEETLDLVREVKPEVSNVSRFSSRPHAEASRLKQMRSEEAKRRSVEMSELVRSVQEESRKGLVGREMRVLATEKNGASLSGRSESYLQVALEGGGVGLGDFANVKITGSTFAYLIGRIR